MIVECQQLLRGNDLFDYIHTLFLQAASQVSFIDLLILSSSRILIHSNPHGYKQRVCCMH